MTQKIVGYVELEWTCPVVQDAQSWQQKVMSVVRPGHARQCAV